MAVENDSWPLLYEKSRILYEKFPINILSIFANSLVIFLSFRSTKIPKYHFRYLIANTAFLGILNSFGGLLYATIFSYLHIFNLEANVCACNSPFLISYFTTAALFWSYAMTIVCRYQEIALSKNCTKMQVRFLISFPYITCLIHMCSFVVFSDGHMNVMVKNGRKCSLVWYDADTPVPVQILLFLLPSVAFFILAVLSYKLYKFLKNHFENTSAAVNPSRNEQQRLAEERSILRAILIQGISPVVLFLPDALIFIFVVLSGWDRGKTELKSGINLIDIVGETVSLNPLIDALSILFVVLSYKKARRKFVQDFSTRCRNLIPFI